MRKYKTFNDVSLSDFWTWLFDYASEQDDYVYAEIMNFYMRYSSKFDRYLNLDLYEQDKRDNEGDE